MLQQILQTKELQKYLTHEIADAGLQVDVDTALSKNQYIGIKVDEYYMGLHLGNETPKVVDFIVSVDCECDWYQLYVLELKNVSSPRQYTSESILEKFKTAVERFMKEDFKHIFLNDKYKYKALKLYLVTSAYGKAMGMSNFADYAKIKTKINPRDTLLYDYKLSEKYFRFRNMICKIEREIPPNPIIQRII